MGYRQELNRSLGTGDLLAYGLTLISPTAVCAAFGIIYDASAGMVPLVYLIGLVAMCFTALSYVAMSREYPFAGSAYAYAKAAFGDGAGFLAGWAMTLDYLLAPALIYIAAAVAINSVLPGIPLWVWGSALLAINTLINLRGIQSVARVNRGLLGLQVLALALFLVLAAVAVAAGRGGARFSLAPVYDPARIFSGLAFGGVSIGMLNYLGFDAISTLSEEARGGASSVAKATVLSLLAASILFIVESWLACLFVLGRRSFPPGIPTYAAFYDIAAVVGGSWLKTVLSVAGVFLANIASALAAQAAISRLFYGMARDGRMPRTLAHVHPHRRVPDRATLLVSAVTLGLIAFFSTRLELLLTLVSFGALTGFLFVHAAVVRHFLWKKGSRDWLRHLVAPALGFAIVALVIYSMSANAKLVGTCWMAAGAAIALLGTRTRRPRSGGTG
ncbi:MAG TPA: APC family permease [Steroidobacteraceae bacterium]|nr:APC family permease [Steroidobacteraceae bacterium]